MGYWRVPICLAIVKPNPDTDRNTESYADPFRNSDSDTNAIALAGNHALFGRFFIRGSGAVGLGHGDMDRYKRRHEWHMPCGRIRLRVCGRNLDGLHGSRPGSICIRRLWRRTRWTAEYGYGRALWGLGVSRCFPNEVDQIFELDHVERVAHATGFAFSSGHRMAYARTHLFGEQNSSVLRRSTDDRCYRQQL